MHQRWLGATLAAALMLAGACGDDDDDATTDATATTAESLGADEQAVQEVIRADIRYENAKDIDAFLAQWTDKGLESYDQGTREEILAGEHHIGEDTLGDPDFVETTVTGDTATATLDAGVGVGVFRVKFSLIREAGKWLLDGFEFIGSPPPGPGETVLDVKAVDYGYDFDASDTASGQFAIKFENTGKEAHEITLFRIPDDAAVGDAKTALEGIDGGELDPATVPNGYEVVGHLTYAEPGQSVDFKFAEPLEEGHYAFVCYIPEGGLDDETGDPVTPNAKPHVSLGMIADLSVA
jgi:hypothetical protein